MDFDRLASSIQELDGRLKRQTATAVNIGLNTRNWLVGAWIVEYEQSGSDRAMYGKGMLKKLATRTSIPGLGLPNLKRCRQFYLTYPQIGATVSHLLPKPLVTKGLEIGATVSHLFVSQATSQNEDGKDLNIPTPPTVVETPGSPDISPPANLFLTRLSFSQIVELTKIADPVKRSFYEVEAIQGNWSVRELKRQIGSLLFERTGLSTNKEKLRRLTDDHSERLQPSDLFRDPYVFEFVGFRPKEVVEESDLEEALLNELQGFLLELGRGFCFEERQKRIQIGSEYYFIDLVFYHRILKCHILIDLKTEPFHHSHPGQLNTYISYFRENEMAEGDRPTIGLLLCTQKDASLVRYALSGMDENLFVSSYQTALPDAKELQRFLDNEAHRLGME